MDGCRGGWVAADATSGIRVFTHIEDLLRQFPKALVLVDMPIGLPGNQPRDLERQARRELPGKGASVFSVPCREAVYASDYQAACEANQRAFGKKISLQTWNICPKIRELDTALVSDMARALRVFESHPELVFARLNQAPLLSGKRTAQGIEERLGLLASYLPDTRAMFADGCRNYLRRVVMRDDILDALALLVCGLRPFQTIADTQAADEQGIPMRLAVPATDSAGRIC